MERFFKMKERGTDVRTETVAGITTFMTMAYILAVNPNILSAAGMDAGAVFTATALASAVSTLAMALFANLPLALSAAMGLNAYFAFQVVLVMGYTWQQALAAVFVEGLIFIALSLTNARAAIFNAIPKELKAAVSVGIGFFICFVGMQNAHIVVDAPTLVKTFPFRESFANGTFRSDGITVLLALLGIVVTAALMRKAVKGAVLWGIIITWGMGMACQIAGLYVPDPAHGFFSLFPSAIVSAPASLSPTFMQLDLGSIGSPEFITILLAFLFVDMFDTIGTVIGCVSQAHLLDEKGNLPQIGRVFMADAVGTTVGALLGTSTVSAYVESSAGIAEGGRTGFASVVTALFFLLALFFSPLFLAVPAFATAPALIIVGFLMMRQVKDIDWFSDCAEAVPAFISIAAMGFMYSIADGISFGIIYYTVLNILAGRRDRLAPLMYVLTALFILKYIYL